VLSKIKQRIPQDCPWEPIRFRDKALAKPDFVHLTQAGVSLLIDLSQDTAEIVHLSLIHI
jgi:hypothetical protein